MAYYFVKKKRRLPKYTKKVIGVGIIFSGIGILTYFFFPLMMYQVYFGGSEQIVEAPVPKHAMVAEGGSLTSLIAQGVNNLTTNFNDARNWYPKLKVAQASPVSKYTLSIPKLKIDKAEVSTIDYDVSSHLVQYAGTSLPGENGTSVIFGHSTLPQWFDPKNYKTIFATLHTIKNGDKVIIESNGVTYAYKVFSITVTSPEDTNMFEQSFDNSYITIITCTPPGTIWKRLIVRAALEKPAKTAEKEAKNKLAQGN